MTDKDESPEVEREPPPEEPKIAINYPSIQHAASELKDITQQLNRAANTIVAGVAINILALAFSLSSGYYRYPYSIPAIALVFSALVTGGVIVQCARYDRARRRGNGIFEEISEELQVAFRSRLPEESRNLRPDLELRLTLRDFNESSRLPFTYSRSGPLLYMGVSLFATLSAWLAVYLISLGKP
jgi:hypothetical protein